MDINEPEITEFPMEFLPRFQRCVNYPRDEEGVVALAQGLAASSRHTGVTMADIVERWATTSPYCPTDVELLATAKAIKAKRIWDAESERHIHAEWRRQYGPPTKFDWQTEAAKILPQARKAQERQRKMWEQLRERFDSNNWPDWTALAVAARELGYHDFADAWEKSGS